jgi:hypothetical protein
VSLFGGVFVVFVLMVENYSAAVEHDGKVISEKLAELSTLEATAKESLNRHIFEIQESLEKQSAVLENHTMILERVSSDVQGVVAAVLVPGLQR